MDKPMSRNARKELLNTLRDKYQSSDWATKNKILDGFVIATNYERKYACRLLNAKQTTVKKTPNKRGKPVYYDAAVKHVLEIAWHASNQICSKRIVPFLPQLIDSLVRHGHLQLTDEVKSKVLSVSPATFDRLLKKERVKIYGGQSSTQPGSLLKNNIPVRTFTDWDEEQPGFFEMDLVAHCGDAVKGVFLNTLVMTDIVTTWTECIALIRKSADDVILGLETASQLLPFSILGCDVDNGSEFINYDVLEYCKKNEITFTRSRAYKKNDQAHVEEKNGSIVRRLIGYDRYETEAAWEAMCQLYSVLRLYINFYQPTLKLLKKKRVGSRTIKSYEKAKTPYQRVLESNHIAQAIKDQLTNQFLKLDPMILKENIKRLQDQLWKQAWEGVIEPVVDELAVDLGNNPKLEESSEPRRYRKTKKASRKRDWRTRKDPFEGAQKFIELELQLNANTSAKEILNKLMKKYPHQFCMGHLRTLQRRISALRAQQNAREQKYQKLMVDKKLMTTCSIR